MSTPMPTQMPNFTPVSPADAREMARASLRGQSSNRSGLFSSIVEGLAPIGAGIANVTGHKTLSAAISASSGGIGAVPNAPALSGGGVGASDNSVGDMMALQQEMRAGSMRDNLQMLGFQQAYSNDNRTIELLSNVSKKKDETQSNSIRNVK